MHTVHAVSKHFPNIAPVASDACFYQAPTQKSVTNVFQELIASGNNIQATFQSVLAQVEAAKHVCHQFHFKYPLQDAEHAKIFAKVLQIKAQEANRFVPVIVSSRFVNPCHLGFLREIEIENGPRVLEHVLADRQSSRVIFIEESSVTPNGQEWPGEFAAVNRVVEENGAWFFTGMYLYPDQPDKKKIQENQKMFEATYKNMLAFIEKEDVDRAFTNLKAF